MRAGARLRGRALLTMGLAPACAAAYARSQRRPPLGSRLSQRRCALRGQRRFHDFAHPMLRQDVQFLPARCGHLLRRFERKLAALAIGAAVSASERTADSALLTGSFERTRHVGRATTRADADYDLARSRPRGARGGFRARPSIADARVTAQIAELAARGDSREIGGGRRWRAPSRRMLDRYETGARSLALRALGTARVRRIAVAMLRGSRRRPRVFPRAARPAPGARRAFRLAVGSRVDCSCARNRRRGVS